MIPLEQFGTMDDSIMRTLTSIDTNHDGMLSANEIKAADQHLIDRIQSNCDTNGEWDLLREISMIRGTYKNAQGIEKGMGPGEGGRFQLMVDRKMAVDAMPRDAASRVAAWIGRSTGKIPSN